LHGVINNFCSVFTQLRRLSGAMNESTHTPTVAYSNYSSDFFRTVVHVDKRWTMKVCRPCYVRGGGSTSHTSAGYSSGDGRGSWSGRLFWNTVTTFRLFDQENAINGHASGSPRRRRFSPHSCCPYTAWSADKFLQRLSSVEFRQLSNTRACNFETPSFR
jgi:hypothetical protein